MILNEHSASYREELNQQLEQLVDGGPWSAWKGKPGGVFLLQGDSMPEAERVLLSVVAQAVLTGDRGTLEQQLDRPEAEPPLPLAQCARRRGPGRGAAGRRTGATAAAP